jgi:transposase-like protein
MDKYSIRDFDRQFPDDDACLEWLKDYLYPDGIFCETCQRVTKHHKMTTRKSYSCDHCGHHVHPTAGTIYHKSRTPLRLWFHAVFLIASTRTGVSAKQLERELGVTYKTAWRMFTKIRDMLDENVPPLSGQVETDETYIGGRRPGKRGRGAAGKAVVQGIVERDGSIVAIVVPDVKAKTLIPNIQTRVLPSSIVYSDELGSYNRLDEAGYEHRRIQHSARVWVVGDVHTNTIEGFWSLVKRGIDGVHHAVSHKYLQHYLDAYTFRWNHRGDAIPMFQTMLRKMVDAA